MSNSKKPEINRKAAFFWSCYTGIAVINAVLSAYLLPFGLSQVAFYFIKGHTDIKSLIFWACLSLYALCGITNLLFHLALLPMWAKRERMMRHARTVSQTLATAKDAENYAASTAQKEKDLKEIIQDTQNKAISAVNKTVQEAIDKFTKEIKDAGLTKPPAEYTSPFDVAEEKALDTSERLGQPQKENTSEEPKDDKKETKGHSDKPASDKTEEDHQTESEPDDEGYDIPDDDNIMDEYISDDYYEDSADGDPETIW